MLAMIVTISQVDGLRNRALWYGSTSEITGEFTSDELLSVIFSSFGIEVRRRRRPLPHSASFVFAA
jgi:hypothetical protein